MRGLWPQDIRAVALSPLTGAQKFDASAATLKTLLARPAAAVRAQAWLTLATVRRVQGRHIESDAACAQVGRAGAALHAKACAAENAALRGNVEQARATFETLLEERVDPAHVESKPQRKRTRKAMMVMTPRTTTFFSKV